MEKNVYTEGKEKKRQKNEPNASTECVHTNRLQKHARELTNVRVYFVFASTNRAYTSSRTLLLNINR